MPGPGININAEKILGIFKKHPVWGVIGVCAVLAVVLLWPFFSSFLTEKGKQFAKPPEKSQLAASPATEKEDPKPSLPESKPGKLEKTKEGAGKATAAPGINQRTEGDQSPAIVSGGDVTITYGEPKKPDQSKRE